MPCLRGAPLLAALAASGLPAWAAVARRELGSGLAVGRSADLWQDLCEAASEGNVDFLEANKKRAYAKGCLGKFKACLQGMTIGRNGLGDVRCGHGNTLVHTAAEGGQAGVIRYLGDIRVDLPNAQRALPLHLAAKQCNKECVSELLEAYARQHAPLSTATMYSGIMDQARRLEDFVDYQDEQGNTALHEAARCGDTGIWQKLVEYGARPGTRNGRGVTPNGTRAELEAVLHTTAKFNGSNAFGGDCCCVCLHGANATAAGALVVTRCGHLFHERCLVQAFDRRKTCAMCLQNLTN